MELWPYGKTPDNGGHKGKSLDELPEDYIIDWCLGQDWLSASWRDKLEEELANRRKKSIQPPASAAIHCPAHLEPFIERIILAGFRECRVQYAAEPAKLKMLQHARDLLEKFAGLA